MSGPAKALILDSEAPGSRDSRFRGRPQNHPGGVTAHGLLQLNGVVKASGARAELEGVARVYDFPSSPRCVDVRVAASDAVKASHIQRSPLSMGGLRELEQWRALVIRKISPSSL